MENDREGVQSLHADKAPGLTVKIYNSNMAAISEQSEPSNAGDAVEAERLPERSGEMTGQAAEVKRDKPPSGPESVGPISESGDASSTVEEKELHLWSYFGAELTRGYLLEHDEARYALKRERVYTFIRIPKELEKMMTYGFFLCMDAFLFVFTFLPLRVIIALFRLITHPCIIQRGRRLEPAQICDILKAVILIACTWLLQFVDVSMLYHIVRGQAVIKLYIIYNMLEVADRLFSSFGQDILDTLFWTATEPRDKKREHLGILPHLLMAVIYVFLHAILVLFQATTLNVAFNSHSKALLTIMMSNNFVELKGSVFKKFEKYNLYQMSCSDIRERYHYMVLLFCVVLRNMTEFNWNIDHFWELIPDLFSVLVAEILVDWVKHAFITKFNSIPAEVYTEYRASLAYDMVTSRMKTAFSDHSDVVSRRMGFIPLPLACLVYRIVGQSFKIHGTTGMVLIFLLYLCLTAFKVLNSILLLGKARQYVNEANMADILPQPKKPQTPPPRHQPQQQQQQQPPPSSPPPQQESPATSSSTAAAEPSHIAPKVPSPINSQTLLVSDSSVNLLASGPDVGPLSPMETSQSLSKGSAAKNAPDRKRTLSEIDRYTLCSNRIV
ncbi:transmembrane anterior posterior transformation protein 1 homolog [Asterias rubens]|uniref:transmembrane anterior posterior transformation protein 1 homolog n=1 Tax=Asterias rubens TaxID=7604 RepID=UPI001455B6C3|nr:transmembrane anterior posterior transformation protein 1 homolog [Asterias rubens]